MVVTDVTPSTFTGVGGRRDPTSTLPTMVLPSWPVTRAPRGDPTVPMELAPVSLQTPVTSTRPTVESFHLVGACGVDPDGFSSAAESICVGCPDYFDDGYHSHFDEMTGARH